jgi:hypothetical protein
MKQFQNSRDDLAGAVVDFVAAEASRFNKDQHRQF